MKNKNLDKIPQSFLSNKFTEILILDLRANNISELPAEMCLNLPSLAKLDVRNNSIKGIPVLISTCAMLSILRLDNNCIS